MVPAGPWYKYGTHWGPLGEAHGSSNLGPSRGFTRGFEIRPGNREARGSLGERGPIHSDASLRIPHAIPHAYT